MADNAKDIFIDLGCELLADAVNNTDVELAKDLFNLNIEGNLKDIEDCILFVQEIDEFRYFFIKFQSSYPYNNRHIKYLFRINNKQPFYNYVDIGRKFIKVGSYGSATIFFNDVNINLMNLHYGMFSKELLFKANINQIHENIYFVYNNDLDKLKNLRKEATALDESESLKKDKYVSKLKNDYANNKRIELGDGYVDNNIIDDGEFRIEFKVPVSSIFQFSDFITYSYYDKKGYEIVINLHRAIKRLNIFNCLWHRDDRKHDILVQPDNLNNNLSNFNIVMNNYFFKIFKKIDDDYILYLDFTLFMLPLGKKQNWFLLGKKVEKRKLYSILTLLSNKINNNDFNQSRFIDFLDNFNTHTLEQLAYLNGIKLIYNTRNLSFLNGTSRGYNNDIEIVLPLEVSFSDGEWNIECGKNKITFYNFSELRNSINKNYGKCDIEAGIKKNSNSMEDIKNNFNNIFGSDSFKIELISDKIKHLIKTRELAVEKSKKLLDEIVLKHANKIKHRELENDYIVKGQLKNYRVYLKSNADTGIGVETYPGKQYICINSKNSDGANYTNYDKLVQFFYALMNDADIRTQISTMR